MSDIVIPKYDKADGTMSMEINRIYCGDWMDAPESVLVIRGTVVELELLNFLLSQREA